MEKNLDSLVNLSVIIHSSILLSARSVLETQLIFSTDKQVKNFLLVIHFDKPLGDASGFLDNLWIPLTWTL